LIINVVSALGSGKFPSLITTKTPKAVYKTLMSVGSFFAPRPECPLAFGCDTFATNEHSQSQHAPQFAFKAFSGNPLAPVMNVHVEECVAFEVAYPPMQALIEVLKVGSVAVGTAGVQRRTNPGTVQYRVPLLPGFVSRMRSMFVACTRKWWR